MDRQIKSGLSLEPPEKFLRPIRTLNLADVVAERGLFCEAVAAFQVVVAVVGSVHVAQVLDFGNRVLSPCCIPLHTINNTLTSPKKSVAWLTML